MTEVGLMVNLQLPRLPWDDINVQTSKMMNKVPFNAVFSELINKRSDIRAAVLHILSFSHQEKYTFLRLSRWEFQIVGCLTNLVFNCMKINNKAVSPSKSWWNRQYFLEISISNYNKMKLKGVYVFPFFPPAGHWVTTSLKISSKTFLVISS